MWKDYSICLSHVIAAGSHTSLVPIPPIWNKPDNHTDQQNHQEVSLQTVLNLETGTVVYSFLVTEGLEWTELLKVPLVLQ